MVHVVACFAAWFTCYASVRLEVDGRRLWEKTKGIVQQRIGEHWPALARVCGIEDTEIDGIRHGHQYNMAEQVHQMFNKILMQRLHCTAHSLMQCLRIAAIKSSSPDNRLRDLAEHVFNMIIDGELCMATLVAKSLWLL